jgi:hypothetical protein
MFHHLWKAHYYNLFCWLILLLKCKYLGHCVGYMVVASVLLGAIVVQHFLIVNLLAAKKTTLEHTIIRFQECSHRKGLGRSLNVSEGRTLSIVCSSSGIAKQIATTIDAIGRTNVGHQVEVCTTPLSQHGVHDTTQEFGSNINLQIMKKKINMVAINPPSC